MNERTILHYENRIAILKSRGETKNDKLIKKMERKMRALQNSTESVKEN